MEDTSPRHMILDNVEQSSKKYTPAIRSQFRHLHIVHGLSYPLARLLLRLTVTLCGVVCNLLSHSLHRMILGENSAGFILHKKQFLPDLTIF